MISDDQLSIKPNLLVKADAIELLSRIADESVQLCYLDPPWFTSVTEEVDLELSRYKAFMCQLVSNIHRVLRNSGSLFWHSTPRLSGIIRPIIDQVFGDDRFQAEFVWSSNKYRRGSSNQISLHDHIYFYSKGTEFNFKAPQTVLTEDEIRSTYPYEDERGRYKLADITIGRGFGSPRTNWREFSLPTNRSWRFSLEKLEKLLEDGQIDSGDSGLPKLKQYANASSLRRPMDSVWDDIPPVTVRSEKSKIEWSSPRPTELLKRIIECSTEIGDLVLDPMCGSGPSVRAAIELNRKWIACDELADHTHESLKGLLEGNCVEYQYQQQEWVDSLPKMSAAQSILLTVPEQRVESFAFDSTLAIEETRHYEFKEVTGQNPVRTIKNAAYEYAIAFLNSNGGKIYWGIRDDRRVVGVRLNTSDRDELRRSIAQELRRIQPVVDPSQYRIDLHPVVGTKESELFVVVVTVPAPTHSLPYFSSSGKCYVKIDGERKELSGPELVAWAIRKFGTSNSQNI